MRILFLLIALLIPSLAQAQIRTPAGGCFGAGDTVTIQGQFANTPQGQIQIRARNRGVALQVSRWTGNRIDVTLPRRGLRAGARYELVLVVAQTAAAGAQATRLGRVQICREATGSNSPDRPRNRTRAPRDVVAAPDGSPEYLVAVAPGQAQAATQALQAQGATLLRTRNLPNLGRTMLLFAFPGGLSAQQAQQLLGGAAPTAALDLHHIYGYAAGPRLYAAQLIGDPEGQSCSLRRAVRVGIIDGPVNPGHAALNGVGVKRTSVLTQGERPTSADHGTAVAGLIAGRAGDLTGFAPGAQIFAAQAFSKTRAGEGARLENVAAGVDWLLGQGVRLVNMSMAGTPNRAFASILALGRGKGMVMIAASGNNGSNAPRYPAAAPDTIAVTAVDANGRAYRKANSGKHIEFSAPGVDVYAAKGNGGGYRSGTSFAAPVVTALVAREAARARLSLDGARRMLRRGVRDLGSGGRDTTYGHGLVQTGGC